MQFVPASTTRSHRVVLMLALVVAAFVIPVRRAWAQATPTDAASAQSAPAAEATATTTTTTPAEATTTPAPQPSVAQAEESPVRTRASLDGGLHVDSADGRFGVQFGALIQYRVRLDEDQAHEYHPYFNSYNVRPQIRMHAFGEQLRVFIQPEIAGESARLLDLELTYTPNPAFRIRAGQFLTPFSRAYLTPIPVMQFSNFGPANDAFRMNRDTGVMFFGTPLGGKLEYDVGVFNGTTINRRTTDPVRLLGMARLQVAPLGAVPYDGTPHIRASQPFRFAIAANGYAGQLIARKYAVDPATGNAINIDAPRRDFQAIGGDFVINVSRLHLTGESYFRHDRLASATAGGAATNVDSWGGQIQAGWFIAPAKLELATRVAFVDPNVDVANDYVASYEGALNYYVQGNHVKFRLDYQHIRTGAYAPASLGYFPGTRQERLLFDTQVFF